jgi:hypothetical protein
MACCPFLQLLHHNLSLFFSFSGLSHVPLLNVQNSGSISCCSLNLKMTVANANEELWNELSREADNLTLLDKSSELQQCSGSGSSSRWR